jgi:hypothetical protein
MPDTTYLDFVKDPDQASRRQEIAAFIGPNPEKFLKVYDQMVAETNRTPETRPKRTFGLSGLCWPAFFLGPVWMFYRKMWGWAAGLTVLAFGIGLLPINTHGLGAGLSAGMAVAGFRIYMLLAVNRVSKLHAAGASSSQIAAAGGVSPVAGWCSGVVLLLAIAIAIYLEAMKNCHLC